MVWLYAIPYIIAKYNKLLRSCSLKWFLCSGGFTLLVNKLNIDFAQTTTDRVKVKNEWVHLYLTCTWRGFKFLHYCSCSEMQLYACCMLVYACEMAAGSRNQQVKMRSTDCFNNFMYRIFFTFFSFWDYPAEANDFRVETEHQRISVYNFRQMQSW